MIYLQVSSKTSGNDWNYSGGITHGMETKDSPGPTLPISERQSG